MNNDNFQYLSDNIKYMGFGENLKGALETKMQEGNPEFQLRFDGEMAKKPFSAALNFRKSDSTDMYFFNNYKASVDLPGGEKREQTFYINKGKGITAKEAFNLLEGRAVLKELTTKDGQAYKAWVQLDPGNKDKHNNMELKQFHENYGFDLKASVGKFAVAELSDSDKEKSLMQSLQKGNVQVVTIKKDGQSHKMFMEADPQFKKVNVYDASMKPVLKDSLEKYQSVASPSGATTKGMADNDKKKELTEGTKDNNAKTKKTEQTLLPKKREGNKKGLGIS